MKAVARLLPGLLAITFAVSACASGHSTAATNASHVFSPTIHFSTHHYSVAEVERAFASQGVHLRKAPPLSARAVHFPPGADLSAATRKRLAKRIRRDSRSLVSLRAGHWPNLVAVTVQTGPIAGGIRWVLGRPHHPHERMVAAARRNVIAFSGPRQVVTVKAALAELP